MKDYIKQLDGSYSLEGGGTYPPRFQEMIETEVAAGTAIVVDYAPSNDEKIAVYRAAFDRHINAKAMALDFDSIIDAVTYADEPADVVAQANGLALRVWRSLCLVYYRDELTTWQEGGAAPTVTELIAGLPIFVAP